YGKPADSLYPGAQAAAPQGLRQATAVRARFDQIVTRSRPYSAARIASRGFGVPRSDGHRIPFRYRTEPPWTASLTRARRDAQARAAGRSPPAGGRSARAIGSRQLAGDNS